jgi:hypothetical protein
MDTPQPQPTNTEANIRKAAEAIAEVLQMKQEFIRCHEFLANRTARLVELLGQAESRGYLLEDSLTLVDTTHWPQHIDWQTKFRDEVGEVMVRVFQPFMKPRSGGYMFGGRSISQHTWSGPWFPVVSERFEKPAPYARAAPPEAQQSFISRKTVAVVPLTGLSFKARS